MLGASSNDLTTQFDYGTDPDQIIIDLIGSHIWDASTVAALDSISTKYERLGKTATIIGMNDASARIHPPRRQPHRQTLSAAGA